MVGAKKRAVTMLLFDLHGKVLAVSRKTDANDFGLPGGKVDEGETDEEALVREVAEETGLTVYDIVPYFIREDDEYICTTFIGCHSGEIHTNEKGVVKWTDWATIKAGSFGEYNTLLHDHHNDVIIGS